MQTISKQQYYLGADLGRERDYSALCLIDAHLLTKDERDPRTFNWITEWRFHVVHLERIPLGNSYVDVASYISDLLSSQPHQQFVTTAAKPSRALVLGAGG
ncbi:MAG: hypothetical protein IT168_27930 [Bryobacterales bacterium]|nr:hypothetical protein [Bryobacterales bacterium]